MSDSTKLLAQLAALPPEEAVKFMQARGLLTQTFDWRDIWHEEHAQQFTVSRLARLDLLQAVYDGITHSVKGELGRSDFMRGIQDILIAEGWWGEKTVTDPKTGELVTTRFDANRLKLIYDINTRQAHSAGLWQRIERNKATSPYIRYITKRDERVRDSHKAWDNLTLPVDHPFWQTHTPLNGWRCRCRIMSMSQADYDKGVSPTGQPLVKQAPPEVFVEWKNKRTGKTMRVPKGVSPGFAYNPGKAGARQAALEKVTQDKLSQVSDPIRQAAEKDFAQPLPKFEPQKTAKACSEWAVKNNLADFADYTGIKPEVANEWNKGLFDALQEFPELRKNQVFTGSAQAQFSRYAEVRRAEYAASLVRMGVSPEDAAKWAKREIKTPKVKGRGIAQSWAQQEARGVAVNAKWGGDAAALSRRLNELEATGWFPPGCNTYRGILDHEIGHQLDDLLKLSIDKEIILAHKEAISKGMKDTVSGYAAAQNNPIEEFIAECWAESCNNPRPRDVARTVAGIIRARYRSRFPA